MNAFMVKVEADLSNGLPSFEVVGLPDAAVKESRDRVRAMLKNRRSTYPVSKITVDLAPAGKWKEEPIYDPPVLAVLLHTSGQLGGDAEYHAVVEELPLSGEVRPVERILSMALTAKQVGITDFFAPMENAPEGAVVEGLRVYPMMDIRSLVMHLTGQRLTPPCVSDPPSSGNTAFSLSDFSKVHGWKAAKRALEITASGSHNVLLIGLPGSGKSMFAKHILSIPPDMTLEEAITTTQIYSATDTSPGGSVLIWERPFRASHHTISPVGLSGGGTVVRPGEISLMHNGVPSLDELPEFHRDTVEVLHQPLEDRIVTISWVSSSVTYPSSTILVATVSPRPCDYSGHFTRACICSSSTVDRYLGKTSGPLLDRLDLHVEVPPVEFDMLSPSDEAESSARIREKVNAARERQNQRFRGMGTTYNARITPNLLHEVCHLSPDAQALFKTAFERMGLSVRIFDRALKISRTIADLDNCNTIEPRRVAEAVQYRTLDRKYWSVS